MDAPFIQRLPEPACYMLRSTPSHEGGTMARVVLHRVDDSFDKQMTAPGRLENCTIRPHTYG